MNSSEAGINIRTYIPQDYPQVRGILEQGGLFHEPIDLQERMEQKITRDPSSIFVAVDSNRVVGTVSIMEDGRMGFIFRLAVEAGHRNRGIGLNLMIHAEGELASRGHDEIHILVEEDNPGLQEYYKKQGYEEGSVYRWMVKERK